MRTECRTAEAWRLRCHANFPIGLRRWARWRQPKRCPGPGVGIPGWYRRWHFMELLTRTSLTRAGHRRWPPTRFRTFRIGPHRWRDATNVKEIRAALESLRASAVSLIQAVPEMRT